MSISPIVTRALAAERVRRLPLGLFAAIVLPVPGGLDAFAAYVQGIAAVAANNRERVAREVERLNGCADGPSQEQG